MDSTSTTDLFRLCSRLFLFLSSFRQKIRRGVRLEPDAVAADLEEIFNEQARAARSDPRLDALYEKARYPLVVVADEILLHSGWDHSAEWEQHIFEEKYFKTNIGGDQFFSIAKELRPDDVEIAAILQDVWFARQIAWLGGRIDAADVWRDIHQAIILIVHD